MKQILIIEDDETIRFGLQRALTKNGFLTVCCSSISEAKVKFNGQVSLILLDWNLPDGTGCEFCQYIKKICNVPVIFLTVRDEQQDIVMGLDLGADDYIIKPFQIAVLLSRINAVLRRSKTDCQDILLCDDIKIDKTKTIAYLHNQVLELTAGEFRLLTILMEHKNQTLTRSQLLDKLWDKEGNFVNDNTLTVTMKRLREKLCFPDCLKTIRGIGYRLEDQE
jgi:DNA-binding response OmpR family regulator